MKGQEMSLFTVQRSVEEQLKKPESKRDILMFEYKLLLLYTAQYGVYVMPQLENIEGTEIVKGRVAWRHLCQARSLQGRQI